MLKKPDGFAGLRMTQKSVQSLDDRREEFVWQADNRLMTQESFFINFLAENTFMQEKRLKFVIGWQIVTNDKEVIIL